MLEFELMVLLRCISSWGKSFLVGELVMGLRLAALAATMEARSEGFPPLIRLDAAPSWSA